MTHSAQAPIIREQRLEYERVLEENNLLAGQLARATEDRDAAQAVAANLRSEIDGARTEHDVAEVHLAHVSAQVAALSRTLAELEDPSIADRGDDASMNVDLDGDAIPRELLTFSTVDALVRNNHTLLKSVARLQREMDAVDDEALRRLERSESEAVREAHDTILALKDELERQRGQLDAAAREREIFRRMSVGRAPSGSHGHANGFVNGHGAGGPVDERLERELADKEVELERTRHESTVNAQRLREDADRARQDASRASVGEAKAKANVDFLNGAPAPHR